MGNACFAAFNASCDSAVASSRRATRSDAADRRPW